MKRRKTITGFHANREPVMIFKNDSVQEAILLLNEDKKLVQKVRKVINSLWFRNCDQDYKDKINVITDYIRKEKLF